MTELDTFIKWCYKEINENEMVALGAIRFVSEHKSHKKNTVTPDKWVKIMAKNMSHQSGNGVTGEEVAKEFNEMIENKQIDPFITRSAKRILEEAAAEFEENPEEFKEKYKELPDVQATKALEEEKEFLSHEDVMMSIAKSSQAYDDIINEGKELDSAEDLPTGDSDD